LRFDYQNHVMIDRLRLLSTIGRVMGLDIYIEAKKGSAQTNARIGGLTQAAPLAKAG
jgi:hypothetical protein